MPALRTYIDANVLIFALGLDEEDDRLKGPNLWP